MVKIEGADGGGDGRPMVSLIRERAKAALRDSDLRQVFELAEMDCSHKAAGAAMKTVLAEKLAEYTIRAMSEARKRKTRLGAAAIIIAAKTA